jgi:predicted nucleic acid-binding protein
MTVVNAGEVWYIIARGISVQEANSSIKELRELHIQFVDADWELSQEATRFMSKNKMSYADCYAAALAESKEADLVTGDSEFKAVEDQIKIIWI